jgi:hypothetical protein
MLRLSNTAERKTFSYLIPHFQIRYRREKDRRATSFPDKAALTQPTLIYNVPLSNGLVNRNRITFGGYLSAYFGRAVNLFRSNSGLYRFEHGYYGPFVRCHTFSKKARLSNCWARWSISKEVDGHLIVARAYFRLSPY